MRLVSNSLLAQNAAVAFLSLWLMVSCDLPSECKMAPKHSKVESSWTGTCSPSAQIQRGP